jgi:hypothetical protein
MEQSILSQISAELLKEVQDHGFKPWRLGAKRELIFFEFTLSCGDAMICAALKLPAASCRRGVG